MKKKVVGLVESIEVTGPSGTVSIMAKLDTGAERSSIDSGLARKLGLGPVLGYVRVKSSAGNNKVKRPVVRASLKVAGEEFNLKIGMTDRSWLRYRAIVGKDILASGKFLIDPSKVDR